MGTQPISSRIARAAAYLNGGGLGPLLVRAVTGVGLLGMFAMVATFGVGIELARMLGVTGYGYYGLALAIITIAGIPGELGISRLATREVAKAIAKRDFPLLFGVLRWADTIAWRISAVMVLALVAGSAIAAGGRPSGLVLAVLFGAPAVPFLALSRIRGGSLQGLGYIVLGQFPTSLLRPLILSLLLATAYLAGVEIRAPAAMAMYSMTAATVFATAHVLLKRRLPALRPAELIRGGRSWIASSIPMALTDGMRVLQSELSVLLLGVLTTPADVGLLRIAIVTSFAAATPVSIINQVAFPVIAKLYAQKDMIRLQIAVTRLAQAQLAGVALLCLPLLLAAGPLLKLVFGAGYVPASDPLRILCVAQVATAALGTNVALLNMSHHERRVTRAMAIALVINFAGVAVLGSVWGRTGAAVGVAAALICWNVTTWRDARRLLGINTAVFNFRGSSRPTPKNDSGLP